MKNDYLKILRRGCGKKFSSEYSDEIEENIEWTCGEKYGKLFVLYCPQCKWDIDTVTEKIKGMEKIVTDFKARRDLK